MSPQRIVRLGAWYRRHQDAIQAVYGAALLLLAGGLVALALHVGSQSSHTAKVARTSCLRSVKYGPYLARLYDTNFPAPKAPGGVFRVMPHTAALAYAESIPKHC